MAILYISALNEDNRYASSVPSQQDPGLIMSVFKRDLMVHKLGNNPLWDIIIIGGGATGLGTALDAASRGYTTLLLEQHDFAKGTSSRSTKLIHGGVRYLAQGDISLVYAALRERGILLKNAGHVVKPQSFIIPCYTNVELIKYSVGLKFYDLLARAYNFQRSRSLSKREVLVHFPNIKENGLRGGVQYFDGQFDDARLAVNIAQTAAEHSAVVLNYMKVNALIKQDNVTTGVQATDVESGRQYTLRSKVVVNATGVFVDDILKMDDPDKRPLVKPSQGVHIVINKKFLKGNNALMIPRTSDGRVLFAVPWQDHLLVGTTDTPLDKHSFEPRALETEIEFILETINQYLSDPPGRKDVLSVFAGLRPLAAPLKNSNSTKEISRDHKLIVSDSKLITITGGKWTTYRKMAEQTVEKSIITGNLPITSGKTSNVQLHGCLKISSGTYLSVYGTDEQHIRELITRNPALARQLVEGHPYTCAEVVWAIQSEMARTIEDVLARRLRLLFLDARAAIRAAPLVADLLTENLGLDQSWKIGQLNEFYELAGQYLLDPRPSELSVN